MLRPKKADRIGQLEAQVEALQSMVLALILACDGETPGVTEATIHVAKSQRESALDGGRQLKAIMLGRMIDTLAGSVDVSDDL